MMVAFVCWNQERKWKTENIISLLLNFTLDCDGAGFHGGKIGEGGVVVHVPISATFLMPKRVLCRPSRIRTCRDQYMANRSYGSQTWRIQIADNVATGSSGMFRPIQQHRSFMM